MAPKIEKWTGEINSNSSSGLVWEAIGDSWTAKNTLGKNVKNYTDYVSEDLGLKVKNSGLGGTGYLADDKGSGNTFVERNYGIADLYTIFGSFNDAYAEGKSFGNIMDTDPNTLYGAVKATIAKVLEQNPKAKIALIAPGPWGNINPQNTHTLSAFSIPANEFAEKYVKVLEEVSKFYSIPFLDLYHSSMLRPWDQNFINEFYHGTSDTDTTHPNTKGHEFFSPQIKEFIKKIYD